MIQLKSSAVITTLIMALFLFVCSYAFASTTVQAIALFNDRAMLSINGKKAKIIHAGKSYLGVKVISSNTSQAVVEIDGARRTLKLNGSVVLNRSLAAKPTKSYRSTIELYVNQNGFFQSDGAINGRTVNFLVDTGANLVVISSSEANKIGLQYLNGQPSVATTASGTASMYLIVADTMSIGGIELNNIEMGVIVGNFPQHPLLGMTFLSRLNMERKGDVMTLTRR